ncbi:MAG TPA: plastocyanin/azurin family copper-binding protein, partial [Actinomadura sp.]|nr:plastocyanin/azurin family copper-binding protein [Actinomadura sp.]
MLAAALSALWLSPGAVAATAQQQLHQAAAQVLTWTADDSMTAYKSVPTTATAGPATIVFENSAATGNTTGMTHTLTFDTSTAGYNHDVDVNIIASPYDANGGRHEVQVNLTPGKYHYYCAIPGHQMTGELVVTDGGGTDTTPPQVSASVSGDKDAGGNYVGSATVAVSASDTESGVAKVEYALDGGAFTA